MERYKYKTLFLSLNKTKTETLRKENNYALRNVFVFRAKFGDPFNTLTAVSIFPGPIDIIHSYVSKT